MRTIARGSTPEQCQHRVNQLKKARWSQVSEVKLDPSPTIDISYACVMERKDNPEKDISKRRWGKRFNEL